MMGPEYFTVAAYVGDGFIVCRECGDEDGLPAKDQLTVATVEAEFPEGLWCDDCGKEIVEPYEEPEDEEEENDPTL